MAILLTLLNTLQAVLTQMDMRITPMIITKTPDTEALGPMAARPTCKCLVLPGRRTSNILRIRLMGQPMDTRTVTLQRMDINITTLANRNQHGSVEAIYRAL